MLSIPALSVAARLGLATLFAVETTRFVELRGCCLLRGTAAAGKLGNVNRQILLLDVLQCLHTFLDRWYLWFLFDCFDGPDAGERTGQSLRGLLTSLLQLRGCVIFVFRYPGLHILHLSDEHLLVNG